MKRKAPAKGKTTTPSPPQGGEGRSEGVVQRGEFYQSVAEILRAARTNAYRAVNFAMVEAYWNVGRMIVEEEQRGEERAGYGAQLIQRLSERLGTEFGRGFSVQSLWNMRQLYQCFPILSAVRRELTWSHYKALIRVESEAARAYYLTETADQNWSTRALERQINSLYYERRLMSQDKAAVTEEMQQKTAPLAPAPQDFIRNSLDMECGDMSPLFQRATRRADQSADVSAHSK